MPTRSFQDLPAGPIRDLRLPGRAVTALTRAGVRSTEQLAVLTRQDLAAIDGLGPGMIAAIRLVVPEPPASGRRSGAPLQIEHPEPASAADDPGPEPAGEFQAPPAIPSFASLRAPQRRTALDLLMPGSPPEPSGTDPVPTAGPRPAEYADLLALGVHVLRAAVAVPVRLVRWSVRAPGHSLRRLLGG